MILFFSQSFASAAPLFDEKAPHPSPIKNSPPIPLLKPIDKPASKPIDVTTASRKEIIDAFSNLSSVPFFITLKGLGIEPSMETEIEPIEEQLFDPADEADNNELSAAAYSVLYTTNAVNDGAIDVEPTTISITKGDRYSTTTYTTTAYIKNPKTTPRIHYSTTTTPSTVFTYKGQLPITGEYTYTADPLAAQNGTRSGIKPGRQYIAGIMFKPGSNLGAPNAIAVWWSDDGGYNWTLKEAVRNDNNTFFLDKPAIAVSEYSATRGHVYIAYVRQKYLTPDSTELYVARSINVDANGAPLFHVLNNGQPLYTGKVNGAQILVNPFNGEIYVIAVDYNLKKIGMASAMVFWPYSNDITSWLGPELIAEGDFLSGLQDDKLKGGVKAGTLPMARFNWVANKIAVVWHEDVNPTPNTLGNPDDIDTDIFFASKTPGGSWLPKKRINAASNKDQFMPGLDYDASGNMTVVFNDRRHDANNIMYDVYMARIDSNGNKIQIDKKISASPTDPTLYSDSFIGDYQDVWSWTFPNYGELFHASCASWVGNNGTKDIFLSTSVRQLSE